MIDPPAEALRQPDSGRRNPPCAALCERTYRHQIPMWRQCQAQGLAQIGGVWLCGHHINASARRSLVVLGALEIQP